MLVAGTKAATKSRLSVRNAVIFSTGSPTGEANLNPDTLLTLKEKKKRQEKGENKEKFLSVSSSV